MTDSKEPAQDTPVPSDNPLPKPAPVPSIKPNHTILGVAKIIGDVVISLGIFGLIYAGKIQAEIGLVFICALLGLSVANLLKGPTVGPTSGATALMLAGASALLHRIGDVTKLSMVALMLVLPIEQMTACSATPRQIAHVTVVSAGAAVASLHAAHQRVYTRATDELRASIRARGGSLADYNTAVEPIDAEFTARSEVLQNIDAHLRAAAAIIDASRTGSGSAWVEAVGPVLTALRITLETMQQGNVLEPVPIPPEVLAILQTLSQLASETQTDAGITNESH